MWKNHLVTFLSFRRNFFSFLNNRNIAFICFGNQKIIIIFYVNLRVNFKPFAIVFLHQRSAKVFFLNIEDMDKTLCLISSWHFSGNFIKFVSMSFTISKIWYFFMRRKLWIKICLTLRHCGPANLRRAASPWSQQPG